MNRLRCASSRAVRLSLLALVVIGAGMLLGCESDDPVDPAPPPQPVAPSIDSLGVPQFWVFSSPMYRTMEVVLSFPDELSQAIVNQDVAAPRVHALLKPLESSGIGETFDLYDDGSGPELETSNAFIDATSGDLIARDLTYTIRLNAEFAPYEGEYLLIVEAGWFSDEYPLPYSSSVSDTLQVEVNSPPVISSFEHSDSLYSGFAEEIWTAEVSDPDVAGGDAVDEVEMHLVRDGDNVRDLLLAPAGSSGWTFTLRASFAAGLPTANYTIRLNAADRFDQQATPYENVVWIENTAPVVTNLVAPDTVYRPEGENPPPNQYDLFLEASDLQTQTDIDWVGYFVVDPQGNIAINPDAFVFNDLGVVPDEVPGDGVYSHRFNVPDSVRVFGTYTFNFSALDRAGNTSNTITQFIELMNTGGK